jgi:hypothetical protein
MSVSENKPSSELELPELSDEQIDLITSRRLESLIDADWVPYPIYRAMSFMAVRFTVELALVKPTKDGSNEVLLIKRPADDEDIPNQWHIPGVGVKQKDPVLHYHDNNAALGRIMTNEVGGDLQIADQPTMLDTVRRVGGGRTEVTTQYWAKVLGGNQENGEFFNMEDVLKQPPEGGLVTTHDATIRRVEDHYQLLNSNR